VKPYKGYKARVEYDSEDQVLVGRIEGIRDVVTFFATDTTNLEREFHASVDEYIAFCRERGEEPERPCSGRVLVRMPAEMHQAAIGAARRERTSLNAWMMEAVAQRLQTKVEGAAEVGANLAASFLAHLPMVHSSLISVKAETKPQQPTVSPRVRFALSQPLASSESTRN
jgi:predicted HicB family RNase H-like nuclease